MDSGEGFEVLTDLTDISRYGYGKIDKLTEVPDRYLRECCTPCPCHHPGMFNMAYHCREHCAVDVKKLSNFGVEV